MGNPDVNAVRVQERTTLEKFEVTEQGPILFETLVLLDGIVQSKTTHNEALLAELLNKEVPDAVTHHG